MLYQVDLMVVMMIVFMLFKFTQYSNALMFIKSFENHSVVLSMIAGLTDSSYSLR